MNTKKEARELMAQERLQDRHLKDSMLNRAEEELETPISKELTEEARELMTEERLKGQHLKESMLNRSEAEIGMRES